MKIIPLILIILLSSLCVQAQLETPVHIFEPGVYYYEKPYGEDLLFVHDYPGAHYNGAIIYDRFATLAEIRAHQKVKVNKMSMSSYGKDSVYVGTYRSWALIHKYKDNWYIDLGSPYKIKLLTRDLSRWQEEFKKISKYSKGKAHFNITVDYYYPSKGSE